MTQHPFVIKNLRNGETVNIDGKNYCMTPGKVDGGQLVPGDLYVGQRNVGPVIRTVRNLDIGAVFPTEFAYAYDLGECVGITEVPEV